MTEAAYPTTKIDVIPAKAGTQSRVISLDARGIPHHTGSWFSHKKQHPMRKQPCVLSSARNGTLYIGVTSDLIGRMSVHVQDLLDGFTAKHQVHDLVYYELHQTMDAAIAREKQLKKWNRQWKLRLIETANPEWIDLFDRANVAIRELPADTDRRP